KAECPEPNIEENQPPRLLPDQSLIDRSHNYQIRSAKTSRAEEIIMAPNDEKARGKSVYKGSAAGSDAADEPMRQPEVAPANASGLRRASGGEPTKVGVRRPQYMISPRPAAPGLNPLSPALAIH